LPQRTPFRRAWMLPQKLLNNAFCVVLRHHNFPLDSSSARHCTQKSGYFLGKPEDFTRIRR
jgi:hypothetical protein